MTLVVALILALSILVNPAHAQAVCNASLTSNHTEWPRVARPHDAITLRLLCLNELFVGPSTPSVRIASAPAPIVASGGQEGGFVYEFRTVVAAATPSGPVRFVVYNYRLLDSPSNSSLPNITSTSDGSQLSIVRAPATKPTVQSLEIRSNNVSPHLATWGTTISITVSIRDSKHKPEVTIGGLNARVVTKGGVYVASVRPIRSNPSDMAVVSGWAQGGIVPFQCKVYHAMGWGVHDTFNTTTDGSSVQWDSVPPTVRLFTVHANGGVWWKTGVHVEVQANEALPAPPLVWLGGRSVSATACSAEDPAVPRRMCANFVVTESMAASFPVPPTAIPVRVVLKDVVGNVGVVQRTTDGSFLRARPKQGPWRLSMHTASSQPPLDTCLGRVRSSQTGVFTLVSIDRLSKAPVLNVLRGFEPSDDEASVSPVYVHRPFVLVAYYGAHFSSPTWQQQHALLPIPNRTLHASSCPLLAVYQAVYTVLPEHEEGVLKFVVSTDRGNLTATSDGSSTIVDHTPPRLTKALLSVTSSGTSHDSNVVWSGDEVVLFVESNEPLGCVPVVTIAGEQVAVTAASHTSRLDVDMAHCVPSGSRSTTHNATLDRLNADAALCGLVGLCNGTAAATASSDEVWSVRHERVCESGHCVCQRVDSVRSLRRFEARRRFVSVAQFLPKSRVPFHVSSYCDLAGNQGANITHTTNRSLYFVAQPVPASRPVSLVALPMSHAVKLTWEDTQSVGTPAEVSYNVQWCVFSDFHIVPRHRTVTTRSLTLSAQSGDLLLGQEYFVRVVAFWGTDYEHRDALFDSVPSDIVRIRVPAPFPSSRASVQITLELKSTRRVLCTVFSTDVQMIKDFQSSVANVGIDQTRVKVFVDYTRPGRLCLRRYWHVEIRAPVKHKSDISATQAAEEFLSSLSHDPRTMEGAVVEQIDRIQGPITVLCDIDYMEQCNPFYNPQHGPSFWLSHAVELMIALSMLFVVCAAIYIGCRQARQSVAHSTAQFRRLQANVDRYDAEIELEDLYPPGMDSAQLMVAEHALSSGAENEFAERSTRGAHRHARDDAATWRGGRSRRARGKSTARNGSVAYSEVRTVGSADSDDSAAEPERYDRHVAAQHGTPPRTRRSRTNGRSQSHRADAVGVRSPKRPGDRRVSRPVARPLTREHGGRSRRSKVPVLPAPVRGAQRPLSGIPAHSQFRQYVDGHRDDGQLAGAAHPVSKLLHNPTRERRRARQQRRRRARAKRAQRQAQQDRRHTHSSSPYPTSSVASSS